MVLAVGLGIMLADFSFIGIGRAVALGGLVFACYQRLDRRISERTQASNETYQLGFDLGYERGFEDGQASSGGPGPRPVIVRLSEERGRRFEAGKDRSFSSAVSAGDRD